MWEELAQWNHGAAAVPMGYMELFDLVLNCYEKLFQYSHFQSDNSASVFVLCLRGVMSGRALIYSLWEEEERREERKRGERRERSRVVE